MKSKKRGALIAVIIAAAVVVSGALGAAGYKYVLRPLADKLASAAAMSRWLDAMAGYMDFFDGLKPVLPVEGANFDFELELAGSEVEGGGYYELGGGLEDSTAYVKFNSAGDGLELALTDGGLLYSDGVNTFRADFLLELLNKTGLDKDSLIKGGQFSVKAAAALLKMAGVDVESMLGLGEVVRAFIRQGVDKGVTDLWLSYCKENREAVEQAVKFDGESGEPVYTADAVKLMDIMKEFSAYAAENGSESFAGLYRELKPLYDGVNAANITELTFTVGRGGGAKEMTVHLAAGKDFSADVELAAIDGRIESAEARLGSAKNPVTLSADFDGAYPDSFELESGIANLNVELDNQGSPAVDRQRLDEMRGSAGLGALFGN